HEIRTAQPEDRWDSFAYNNLSIEINQIQRVLTSRLLSEDIRPEEYLNRNKKAVDRLQEIKQSVDHDREKRFSSY
ncbi:MAG: hypothetical protein ABEJ65_07125, partial [bacterium]